MALVSIQSISLAYGGHPLLDNATLQLDRGEKIGFLGRNGEGKSTLLGIIGGDIQPDHGEVVTQSGVTITYLPQTIPSAISGSVRDVVLGGSGKTTSRGTSAERLCSQLGIEPEAEFQSLSGGQQRRTLLARALVDEPDVLLLDEPTNHLDIQSIQWVESFLARFHGCLLFVTHDRAFLQAVANRIVELDRGRLTSWSCDYPTFLRRKEALLQGEEKEWAEFDKKLAREEQWIREGIKARRTRNEGRVRALKKLRDERAARRERVGQADIQIQNSSRSGRKVIDVKNLHFAYPGTPIVQELTTTIMRGDKVGILGSNGCGKTTLLRLLLGQSEPQQGTVKHGTSLEVAYFDQHRDQLDESRTVMDSVARGNDWVTVQGQRRHVAGYLQDFLFSPDRMRQEVASLSGGERSRLLLARLFTLPSNLLVLDEPTNDLDTETLEMLEARLLDYPGTVLVVSHDRRFLDNLCSSTLVFEGEGLVREYVGGYSDWLRMSRPAGGPDAATKPKHRSSSPAPTARPTRKLTNKEREEWTLSQARIEAMEQELEQLHATMSEPGFFRGDAEEIRKASDRAAALPQEIETTFARWAELDERA
jgi:ATP-binding cassette subfamily F protein uup